MLGFASSPMTPSGVRGFSNVVRESIQNGIRNVLGGTVLEATRSLLHLDEFAEKPEELHNQLSPIFGQWGARTLEKVIVKELFERLRIPLTERDSFYFEQYVDQARIRLSNTQGGNWK